MRAAHTLGSRSQRGFSLIELMVGLTIGLVLVAGLALLFANSSQSAGEMDKSVRQIENGRFAVDLLAEDISMAGYFGEAVAGTVTTSVSPCSNTAAAIADLEVKRALSPAAKPFGIEGLSTAEVDALSACLPNHKTNTPAIIIRRLDPTKVSTASMTASIGYVQASNNESDLNATYLASTNAADLVLKDLDGTTNKVRQYIVRVYYIATCNECDGSSPLVDTIPTLKRAELKGTQVVVSPLVEGIDQIGFDFAFDTDGDGTPDQWRGLNKDATAANTAAAAVLGWGNVVGVKIYAVSRTTEASPGFTDSRTYPLGLAGTASVTLGPVNDNFKRRAYVTTARLNNIAGPRETP